MKLTTAVLACGIVFSWLTSWTAILAAEPPATPGETKQAAPVAVAITDSEIIPRAEQTLKSLQKLKSEVEPDATLNAIQKDFAAFAEESDRRRESEAETIGKSRSVQRLNDILREWSLEQSQLNDWDQALAKQSQILVAREREIDEITTIWRATQAAVAKKFLFKAVLERRVEEVLREAQATRLAIQAQTTKLLKLQSQIADRLVTLAGVRKEIDQARREFSRGLFALDSPPLWEALFRPEAHETVLAEASGGARRILPNLQEFGQKYNARIPLHLLLFLALAAALVLVCFGTHAKRSSRIQASENASFCCWRVLCCFFLPCLWSAISLVICRLPRYLALRRFVSLIAAH